MPQKLLKSKPRKTVAMKAADDKQGGIVVVGNYKERQLAWIEKNGVYNWPVREDDSAINDGRARTLAAPCGEDFSSALARVKELWLYASAKSARHVFSAEFVGKMTNAEFRAAYPSYAKLGPSKQKAYYVFKTTPVDYPPELGSQIVIARTADFGKRCVKVKKAIEQFKQDGEFAPLAAYLPKELATVPRPQLRVCEAAVQLAYPAWSPIKKITPQYEKIESLVLSINTFSRKNEVSSGEAFKYLEARGGLFYLDEEYETSRCFSLEDIVADMKRICRRNGGTL